MFIAACYEKVGEVDDSGAGTSARSAAACSPAGRPHGRPCPPRTGGHRGTAAQMDGERPVWVLVACRGQHRGRPSMRLDERHAPVTSSVSSIPERSQRPTPRTRSSGSCSGILKRYRPGADAVAAAFASVQAAHIVSRIWGRATWRMVLLTACSMLWMRHVTSAGALTAVRLMPSVIERWRLPPREPGRPPPSLPRPRLRKRGTGPS